MKKILYLLVLGFLFAGCATKTENPAETNSAAEKPGVRSVDVVEARPQEVTLTAGDSGEATVKLQITNGYHVNANPPTFPYLKPTELEITPAEGIAVEFMTYPDPLTRKFAFSEQPLAVYEGETILKARLKADKTAKPGKHNLSAKLRVQACDDKVCYAPGTVDLIVPVNVK